MTLVIALGHRFSDLSNERAVLSEAGIELQDAANSAGPEQERLLARADGILLGAAPLPADGLSAMPRCRALVRYGVGIDNVDLKDAAARGIVVSRVPDYGSGDVALHATALILALARRLPVASGLVREGGWGLSSISTPRRPESLTVGIVGLGRIGSAVAKLTSALGFRVAGYDVIGGAGIEVLALDDLLGRSDFLTIHAPLTVDTHHLIGARELRLMPQGSYVVNTARGGLVDEDALEHAIGDGWIAGAALDVFEHEPPASDHPLLSRPEVIVTPHMGWYSAEARDSLQRQAAEEMVRILVDAAPRWAVS